MYCSGSCIKKGIRNSVQKYRCKSCGKYFQSAHKKARRKRCMQRMGLLSCSGCGIRDMAWLLHIPVTTVQRWLLLLSRQYSYDPVFEPGGNYEIDELRTYCGKKKQEHWVMYALHRESRQIVYVLNGSRTKANLQEVVKKVLSFTPRKIYTDGLPVYKYLVPSVQHGVFQRCINYIERKNLTLRQHLRRLSRRTLGYSRSPEMLQALLRIYCCVRGTQML